MPSKNNSNKVENTPVQVSATKEMNDRDYLNDLLATEKCLVKDLTTFVTESSNQELLTDIDMMLDDVKKAQRDLFNLAFENGWYKLEAAEKNKINEKKNSMNTLFKELSK